MNKTIFLLSILISFCAFSQTQQPSDSAYAGRVFQLVSLFLFCALEPSFQKEETHTYTLEYPPNFDVRVMVPGHNPTTKEGII